MQTARVSKHRRLHARPGLPSTRRRKRPRIRFPDMGRRGRFSPQAAAAASGSPRSQVGSPRCGWRRRVVLPTPRLPGGCAHCRLRCFKPRTLLGCQPQAAAARRLARANAQMCALGVVRARVEGRAARVARGHGDLPRHAPRSGQHPIGAHHAHWEELSRRPTLSVGFFLCVCGWGPTSSVQSHTRLRVFRRPMEANVAARFA